MGDGFLIENHKLGDVGEGGKGIVINWGLWEFGSTMQNLRNNTGVSQLLLEHSPDIEAREEGNCTPLYLAVWFNSSEVAQLLHERNPEIEVRISLNQKFLYFAV